jgi:hypothetical protein
MQPLLRDEHGRLRFKSNAVVNALLDHGQSTNCGLNELRMRDFPQEDWEQFYQLIGFSVSGYGDVSVISRKTVNRADKRAAAFKAREKK